jgi:hypothetical protein
MDTLTGNYYDPIIFTTTPLQINVYGNYLYINLLTSQIALLNLTTHIIDSTITCSTRPNNSVINPYAISINYPFIFITGGTTSDFVQKYLITDTPNIICFKEDTKILTDKGYLPIQDLRKGDLVKTLLNGYQPIFMIGKKNMYHHVAEERIKNQLYKCSKKQYPELFEDLVITGCHCILVEEFNSEKEKEKTIEVNGNIYITDDKYRLPACANEKTTVYETQGNHTIYHFALENNDYYMNYGVFANGLLVETTSKRFMNELTDMDIIE